MTRGRTYVCILAGALLLIPVACNGQGGDDGVGSTGGGSGHIAVRLTDKPIDISTVQSVNVTIDSVEVFPADGSFDTDKIELMPRAETFDLLTLTGGVTTLLAEGDLDNGYYTKIRLGVPEANMVMDDGSMVDLMIASHKVDINLPFQISQSESMTVTLDFDAAASVHVTGTGSGKYILRPVVTGIASFDPDPIDLPGPVDPNEMDPNAPVDPNEPMDPNSPMDPNIPMDPNG